MVSQLVTKLGTVDSATLQLEDCLESRPQTLFILLTPGARAALRYITETIARLGVAQSSSVAVTHLRRASIDQQ